MHSLDRRQRQAKIGGQRIRCSQRHDPESDRAASQSLQDFVNCAVAAASQNRVASPANRLLHQRRSAPWSRGRDRHRQDACAAQDCKNIVNMVPSMAGILTGKWVVDQRNPVHSLPRFRSLAVNSF